MSKRRDQNSLLFPGHREVSQRLYLRLLGRGETPFPHPMWVGSLRSKLSVENKECMCRAKRKGVYLSSDVSKQGRADGLEEIVLLGTLAVTVPVLLTIIVATEQTSLKFLLKSRILASLDSVFTMEVLVKNYLSDPCLLGKCAFPRTALKLVSRHS